MQRHTILQLTYMGYVAERCPWYNSASVLDNDCPIEQPPGVRVHHWFCLMAHQANALDFGLCWSNSVQVDLNTTGVRRIFRDADNIGPNGEINTKH